MKNKKRIARLESEVAELKTTVQFLEYRLAHLENYPVIIQQPEPKQWWQNPVIATWDTRGELPPDMV